MLARSTAFVALALAPTAAFHAPLNSALRPHAATLVSPPLPRTATARLSPAAARVPPPLAVADSPELELKLLDAGSLGRYFFAILIQIFLVSTAFGFVDLYCYGPLGGLERGAPLPWQAVVGIFLAMSLRSRLFSPLDNSRPDLVTTEEDEALKALLESGKGRKNQLREEAEKRGLLADVTMDKDMLTSKFNAYFAAQSDGSRRPGEGEDRTMPSWTPPGVTFPIMWVLVVAPLRAFAASLVYEASTGRLNQAHLDDPVLLWLVLHLCIGDTWNTVNNVERRTGAAVPGVTLVWLSTLFAAKQFYDVSPLAGGMLAVTAVWITVAGALVADTWRINNAVTPEPLYPYKAKGMRSQTRFWFE